MASGLAGVPALAAPLEPPILRAALEAEPATLDWQRAEAPTDRFLARFLMRGLFRSTADAKPECDLCRDFTVSPDGLRVQIRLRPGIKWSDGAALESQQFVDAFRRLLDPAQKLAPDPGWRNLAGAGGAKRWDPKKLGVRALAKDTLELEFVEPVSEWKELLSSTRVFPIRAAFAGRSEAHAQEATLGPYFLAAWEKGRRIVFEANPEFTDPRPVYRVEFALGKHAEFVEKLRAGRLDLIPSPTTEDILRAAGAKLQVNPYWATRVIGFNFKRKLPADAAFRRAVRLALDRDSFAASLKNGERRATGLIPPGLPGHRAQAESGRLNLEQAQSERNRVVPWPRWIDVEVLASTLESDRLALLWLEGQLARIHVRVKPLHRNAADFARLVRAGTYDLVLRTVVADRASSLGVLRYFDPRGLGGGGGWSSVGYEALLDQLVRESRPAEQDALVRQALELLESRDSVAVPLGFPTQAYLLGARVKSFATTPFGDPDLVRIEVAQ